MLFLVTIFFTKLPSLAALRNGLISLIYFTSLRTCRIFNAKYIVNVDDINLLILGRLGTAGFT